MWPTWSGARDTPTRRFPWRACAGAAAALIALNVLPAAIGGLVPNAFCRPAAVLAGFYYHAPAVFDPDGAVLPRAAGDVAIHEACSGYQFFAMLFALAVFALLERRSIRRALPAIVVALPAAYLVAVPVNACRIVAVVEGANLFQGLLPLDVLYALHLGTGVAVFFPVLIAAYYVLSERKVPAHVHT